MMQQKRWHCESGSEAQRSRPTRTPEIKPGDEAQRTREAQLPVHKFRSRRIIRHRHYMCFLNKGDRLEFFMEHCGKESSNGDEYGHNNDVDNDSGKHANGVITCWDRNLSCNITRKKRSMHSLGLNNRGLLREGSKYSTSASHIARLISLWSKEAVFPSWGNKKPRAENGRRDVQVHRKLDIAVQQTQQHANCDTVCTPPTCQQERLHVIGMLLGEHSLLTHSNSPDLLLKEVLEQLPKDSTESELTSSLHGDDASIKQLNMVVYNKKKEMVISKSTKSRIKIRAKVHLDAENERMWPLLVLGGIPIDFEDVLYWEKERAIMKKHVSLFIHNMQAVQGDKHFSPWKGSVLDSVVGAFLTQNVSDHLSSSAYMSIAARYPSKRENSTGNTNLSDTTLNRENESALELSRMSFQIERDIIAESLTFKQWTTNGSWSSPDPRTEVCRSLFQNHGNKRRRALSGIERAHLEENQYGRKKSHTQDWESMRRQTLESCSSNEKACRENLRKDAYQDSVNWDAVRRAPVEELAESIKERGMHHVLSGRIKAFLNTLHEEQGNLDLEWLKKMSPENAKAYLTNIRGLGLKSVECIRLLTLHHVAFPVDVNVGRICVRLGWVPIEPLPEELQLHLLELYPVQETIQKFLWNRLWMLDQKTLYELHYQLITFGKVFCTKRKPNCNACPMRTNCKHFASAYASAKLLLTGPENEPSKRSCSGTPIPAHTNSPSNMESKTMMEYIEGELASQALEKDYYTTTSWSKCQQYFVEEPASPEKTYELELGEEIGDIEDFPYIYGSLNDFTEDLLEVSELPYKSMNGYSNYAHKEEDKKWEQDNKSVDAGIDTLHNTTTDTASDINADVNEGATSALVSLPEGAYIPAPKLKNIDRLRTVHYVYELPDDHPLLEHAEIRDTDDPSFYLLAIWSPGEAPDSLSGMDEDHQEDLYRFFANTNANETVSGTLLIPCRTAMRGSFPLNGTYFQVNEVFADHNSSLRPFQVPRSHIWRLQRRFVYFGTSVSNIFRGLALDEIKNCFLRGYVCVRGFDRKYKTPRRLVCRLHFPISKQIQRHKKEKTEASYKSRTI